MKVYVVRLPGRAIDDAKQPCWMGMADNAIEAAKYALARGIFQAPECSELAVYDQDGNPPELIGFKRRAIV